MHIVSVVDQLLQRSKSSCYSSWYVVCIYIGNCLLNTHVAGCTGSEDCPYQHILQTVVGIGSLQTCAGICFGNEDCIAFAYGVYVSYLSSTVNDCVLLKHVPDHYEMALSPASFLSCTGGDACDDVPLHDGSCAALNATGSQPTSAASTCVNKCAMCVPYFDSAQCLQMFFYCRGRLDRCLDNWGSILCFQLFFVSRID